MSYNLLLDTNFCQIEKHWKLTNCEYKDGYLVGNSKVYSIEQEIVLPDPTIVYFSFDYLCFDTNIKKVYCGIQHENGTLEAVVKTPRIRRRKRISVVDKLSTEKVKVIFIIEAETETSRIYVDSPMLVDLVYQRKATWTRSFLNTVLDYRYGYEYTNEYHMSEIQLDSEDFSSPYTNTEKGKIGILAKVTENDWFKLNHPFQLDHTYLVKLDYEQINKYGQTYMAYGKTSSVDLDDEQLYMIFKANGHDELKLHVENKEQLPYLINLKHVMIIDITNKTIDEDDIRHLPFV